MEPAVITRAPFPTLHAASKAAVAPPRRFAAISVPATSFGGGGGGGRFSAGGGGGRGDDSYDAAGAFAAAAAAVAALGETEVDGDDPLDAIVLQVGGMSCGGCAGKVKRILESQPEVSAATIDFEKAIAFVWTTTPESKATEDWKELGEKLANHLTTCGFQSHLQDEGETKQSNASAISNE